MPPGLFTLPRVTPHRGGASSEARWQPAPLWVEQRCAWLTEGVTGIWWAMAHMQPTSSRAIATTTWVACCPRASSGRLHCQRRTGAFQLMSWMALSGVSSCRDRCRLTLAGEREAHVPPTMARRAWVLPALGMAPCRRRAPLDYAEGSRPKHFSSGLGWSKRMRAPSSARVVTATVHGTPHRAWRAATTGDNRQAMTCGSRKPVATVIRQMSVHVITPPVVHHDDATHRPRGLP
jgi:hypothetical protein